MIFKEKRAKKIIGKGFVFLKIKLYFWSEMNKSEQENTNKQIKIIIYELS